MANDPSEQLSMQHAQYSGRRKRRLRVELPAHLFPTAFSNFSNTAQAFTMGLSEELHRKFAVRYLMYLQEVAHGSKPVKPHPPGGCPAFTLIRAELERLFQCYFSETKGAGSLILRQQ